MRRFRHAPVEIPPAWARGRNETAYGRVGVSARVAVGLRSRAIDVARLETSLCGLRRSSPISYVHSFCLFNFYELATPVARERNPTAPRATRRFVSSRDCCM